MLLLLYQYHRAADSIQVYLKGKSYLIFIQLRDQVIDLSHHTQLICLQLHAQRPFSDYESLRPCPRFTLHSRHTAPANPGPNAGMQTRRILAS